MKLIKISFCAVVIAGSLFLFIYHALLRGFGLIPDLFLSADFENFYAAGNLWKQGLDSYNYELFRNEVIRLAGDRAFFNSSAYFYPPQVSVFFSILASFNVDTARTIFLVFNTILLIACFAMLAYILSKFRSLGLPEIALLASFLNTGFARNNIREGQVGIIVCFLLLTAFLFAWKQHQVFAVISLAFISFKPTFLPLYLGYYLLRHKYLLIAVCVVLACLLTLLPLFFTERSVVVTLNEWINSLKTLDTPGDANDPSPEMPGSAMLLNLAPLVYRIFNNQSTLTVVISWVILLLLCGLAAYLIRHSLPSLESHFLDFSLVSILSILIVYHRIYDVFLLFPGLLYLYQHAMNTTNKVAQRKWLGLLVLLILVVSLPVDLLTNFAINNKFLQNNYLWRVIAPIQTWAELALLSTLLWLKFCQVTANADNRLKGVVVATSKLRVIIMGFTRHYKAK